MWHRVELSVCLLSQPPSIATAPMIKWGRPRVCSQAKSCWWLVKKMFFSCCFARFLMACGQCWVSNAWRFWDMVGWQVCSAILISACQFIIADPSLRYTWPISACLFIIADPWDTFGLSQTHMAYLNMSIIADPSLIHLAYLMPIHNRSFPEIHSLSQHVYLS